MARSLSSKPLKTSRSKPTSSYHGLGFDVGHIGLFDSELSREILDKEIETTKIPTLSVSLTYPFDKEQSTFTLCSIYIQCAPTRSSIVNANFTYGFGIKFSQKRPALDQKKHVVEFITKKMVWPMFRSLLVIMNDQGVLDLPPLPIRPEDIDHIDTLSNEDENDENEVPDV